MICRKSNQSNNYSFQSLLYSGFRLTLIPGDAKEALVLSSTESPEKHSYQLTWRVESHSPIARFLISWRRVGDEHWRQTSVPVDIPDYDNLKNFDEDITAGSFLFTNLKEASLYQVKIASENTFGMSNPKNIFTFATKGAGT